MTDGPDVPLLGAAEIRALAARHGIRPTKQWGQNFVVDGNTVRRIVRVAGVGADDTVVEVGPGLGSLTLALLPVVDRVVAVEVDPVLAGALPGTVERHAPRARRPARGGAGRRHGRAPTCPARRPRPSWPTCPTTSRCRWCCASSSCSPSLRTILVMVQLEVAERLAAPPGSRTYGVPSVKAAWYADVRLAGSVSRSVFWPVPNVDSGLVMLTRREPPATTATRAGGLRVRRRGLRPAAQDPAGGAGHLGRLAGAGRGGAAWRPGSTPAPVASSSTWRRSRRSPPRARRPAPSARSDPCV